MDIKQSLSYRHEIYQDVRKYNTLGFNKYNYEKEGILRHTLPKILFKGNTILVTFLQLIDLKIIMVLKYIERLRRFKYISWY